MQGHDSREHCPKHFHRGEESEVGEQDAGEPRPQDQPCRHSGIKRLASKQHEQAYLPLYRQQNHQGSHASGRYTQGAAPSAHVPGLKKKKDALDDNSWAGKTMIWFLQRMA